MVWRQRRPTKTVWDATHPPELGAASAPQTPAQADVQRSPARTGTQHQAHPPSTPDSPQPKRTPREDPAQTGTQHQALSRTNRACRRGGRLSSLPPLYVWLVPKAPDLPAKHPFASRSCLQRQPQLLELLAYGLELDRDKRTQSRETQPEHGLEELLHFNLHFVCLSQAYAAAPLLATKARSVYA